MKKIIVLLILVLTACTDTTNSALEIPAEQQQLLKGLTAFSLPLKVDTGFILKADTSRKLSYAEIRELGQDFIADSSASELVYSFNEACRIDSLKKNHGYAAYVNNLDIGMTRDAIAYRLGYVVFKNKAVLLVWGITDVSYDACPVFSGTRIIGSYRHNNGKYTHMLLGNRSYAADPPSTYQIMLTTEISSNEKFVTESTAVSDDLDVPGEETTTTLLRFKIDNDALKITKAVKEVRNTE